MLLLLRRRGSVGGAQRCAAQLLEDRMRVIIDTDFVAGKDVGAYIGYALAHTLIQTHGMVAAAILHVDKLMDRVRSIEYTVHGDSGVMMVRARIIVEIPALIVGGMPKSELAECWIRIEADAAVDAPLRGFAKSIVVAAAKAAGLVYRPKD